MTENNSVFADWIYDVLKALEPPKKIKVSKWADENRILLPETSAEPGPWNTNRTPYLRYIMDLFNEPETEEIVFLKPTQVGGTEGLNNVIGYIVAQDPSPTLIVYPTIELAEYTSTNRLQPMFLASEQLKEKFYNTRSKKLELQFDGMQLYLAGANSASSLATRPVKYVLFDETDKYPKFTRNEANPLSLGKERQRTFPDKKTFKTSTPTNESGEIWQSWLNADSQMEYHVCCPHCGAYQTLKFKQLKWNKVSQSIEENSKTSYYECEKCKGQIRDFHKPQMLKTGRWEYLKNEGKKKVALRINSLYSPWLKFSDIVYEFLTSKNRPETLLNFVNSWLAEPWKDINSNLDIDLLKQHESEFEESQVPNEAVILTGGIDVQKDCFYWTIRAWGLKMTSWNIAHGIAISQDEVDYIMNRVFSSACGEQYQVNLAGIDSGNDTDKVYDFVAEHSDWAVPVKGSSRELNTRYKISSIEKANSRANGLKLYLVNTSQYKDMISSRLNTPCGERSWMLYKNTDAEYMEHICSEEKVLERKGVNEKWVWKPKGTSRENHWLDCEVYAACAADILGVRYLTEDDLRIPVVEEQNVPQQTQDNNYIGQKNWFATNRNWIK